jgi:CRP-like cAMP-binding protein
MITGAGRAGVWGLIEGRLAGEAPPEPGGLWDLLGTLVNPGDYRPKLSEDIEVKEFGLRSGEPYYMLANPRDLVHYRLEADSYELVRLMDGTRTVKEIVLERLDESGEIDVGGVADLVYQLRSENFLDDRFQNVEAMVAHQLDPQAFRSRARKFATTLSIEWNQSERPVKWLYDHGFRYALSKPFALLSLFVIAGGFAAFIANIRSGLFGLYGESIAVGFFVLLAVQYFMIGVHELGHALVLVKNGRRIKGAGFMIYFGCPAFYVDSSDGLMMERGQRILQAFAGPFAQSIGAGLASILAWAFPQLIVSETLYAYTVLAYLNIFLNLIPLLELDGYWMLSDWLRTPDLRPRSMEFMQHDLLYKLRTRERFTRAEMGLLLYAVFGVIASVLLIFSGYLGWKVLFGNVVSTLWEGGLYTRILLVALALFILNPILRALINLVRAIGRRVRAGWRALRFRLQKGWRVEAAELIDGLALFDDVPEDVLSDLAGRVRLRGFRAGQAIVRQGERADAFFVVRRGVLQVVEEDPETGADLRTLRALGRGEAFGELGLVESAPRAATVRAVEDGEVFVIDKGTFGELLASHVEVPTFAPTLQALAEVRALPCFAHLEVDELAQVLEHGRRVNVPPGAAIVTQGEVGDAFYALSSGQVEVLDNGRQVSTLGPGSHFGEIALLLDVPRTATVRALTPVTAFRLDRPGFDLLVKDAFRYGTLNPALPLDRVEEH